jgi:hypothetical protein
VPSPGAEVTALRSVLERAAADREGPPAARARALKAIRDDIAKLLAQADGLLAGGELRQQAGAMDRRYGLVKARQRADVRDRLLGEGGVTPEALDALGYLSHDRLDAAEEEGTLEATIREATVA